MHSSLGNVMEKVLAVYRKSSKQWCSTLNKLADGVLLLAYSLLKFLWHDKHKVPCNLTTSRIKQMEKQFPGAITFAAPCKQWYLQHYDKDLGRKKKAVAGATKKEGEEAEGAPEEAKKSNHVVRKIEKRQEECKLNPHVEEQFSGGRLLAAISSRPDQCGRADGGKHIPLLRIYLGLQSRLQTL